MKNYVLFTFFLFLSHFSFSQLVTPDKGFLRLIITPSYAKVYVDNKLVPNDTLLTLDTGSHTVNAYGANLLNLDLNVHIDSRAIRYCTFTLAYTSAYGSYLRTEYTNRIKKLSTYVYTPVPTIGLGVLTILSFNSMNAYKKLATDFAQHANSIQSNKNSKPYQDYKRAYEQARDNYRTTVLQTYALGVATVVVGYFSYKFMIKQIKKFKPQPAPSSTIFFNMKLSDSGYPMACLTIGF